MNRRASVPSSDTPMMAEAESSLRACVLTTAQALNPSGLNQGKAGNVSARCTRTGSDGHPREGYLITPSGLPYARTRVEDLVWLALDADPDADPQSADGPWRPSSEWRFHRDVYRTRPDAGAVVHVHAPACTSLACLPRVQRDGIPAFHYMIAVAGGVDIRCAAYATFGTQALSDAVLSALQGRSACLMAHHGMVALGADTEAALALAIEVESLAQMYAQALQLGEPGILSQEAMQAVLMRFAGYGQAHPNA